jgi:hypothetical protein
MNSHHHDRRHVHGHRSSADAPPRVFWTKRRLAVTAIIALVAMAVFVFLTACDRGPAPRGPAPVPAAGASATARPADPNAGSNAGAPAAGASAAASQAGSYRTSGPDGDQSVIAVGGLLMPKPVTWVWTAPSMQFRALQYAVPANGVNSPAAELVFSVFMGTDGGPLDANLDRWAQQFRSGDGAAPAARSQTEVAGLKVWRIESKGDYMGMGAAAPRPGYMQLGAIVQAPGRNVFMKLVGPEATVESNRAAFEAMVAGLRQE